MDQLAARRRVGAVRQWDHDDDLGMGSYDWERPMRDIPLRFRRHIRTYYPSERFL